MGADRAHDGGSLIDPGMHRVGRFARQHLAVRAQQQGGMAGVVGCRLGEEACEILRAERDVDGAVETAIRRGAAAADGERAGQGGTPAEGGTDVEAGVGLLLRGEEFAPVDLDRPVPWLAAGLHGAVGIGDPDRYRLFQRQLQPGQEFAGLRGGDLVPAQVVDAVVDAPDHQFLGFEHLACVFMHDVRGTGDGVLGVAQHVVAVLHDSAGKQAGRYGH